MKIYPIGLLALISLSSCGGGGGNSSGQGGSGGTPPANTLSLRLVAGNLGGIGSTDGNANLARFYQPGGTAVDATGNVYVADTANCTIRKVSPAGMVSTLAGSAGTCGGSDGTGSAASFSHPAAVAADASGNVYVADGNSAIRKITAAGVVSTLAGTANVTGSADGSGSSAAFNGPQGVAVDTAGDVFVADTGNNTVRKITPSGVVSTLAGTAGNQGSNDGTGAAASFGLLEGIAVDTAGNVYVSDAYVDYNYENGPGPVNVGNAIRKITPTGVVTRIAGSPTSAGWADGTGSSAAFVYPTGLGVDGLGNVYIADSGNDIIRKMTSAGVVTTIAGSAGMTGGIDGKGSAARFNGPVGLSSDAAGNLYVTERANGVVRKVATDGTVSTYAGAMSGSADGTGTAAGFLSPQGLAADTAGNIYVADTGNGTIRKMTPAGAVTTLASSAGRVGVVDGSGGAAAFASPSGLAVDAGGNIYVADTPYGFIYGATPTYNFYGETIREVSPAGNVTTYAGTTNTVGATDGTGAAARFAGLKGLAIDGSGNLYVADTNNQAIRKIAPGAVVTTLAGTAGAAGSADGTGAAARFNFPLGVAADSAGNVYVSDTYNCTVRKITPAGAVTTLAGKAGTCGNADGSGTAASFNYPTGIAVDGQGTVYVADTGNGSIRVISPAGVVSTAMKAVPGPSGTSPSYILQGLVFSGGLLYVTSAQGVLAVVGL